MGAGSGRTIAQPASSLPQLPRYALETAVTPNPAPTLILLDVEEVVAELQTQPELGRRDRQRLVLEYSRDRAVQGAVESLAPELVSPWIAAEARQESPVRRKCYCPL